MKNTLRVERAKLNWTQADLAERAGVSRQSVNAIETGRYVPSTILALKLAELFQVSVHQLFQLEPGDASPRQHS